MSDPVATGALVIGRDQDRGTLLDLAGRSRVVTLVGLGGVGKTTLARAALADRDDAVFVDLTKFGDDAVRDGLAAELDYASFDAAVAGLQAEPTTIVMDNCEHVLDTAAAVVAEVVDRCPDVRVIATSRRALALPDEHVLRLEPLPTAGEGSPAAQLLAAAAARRGERLDPNHHDVMRLVRALDGLPLAIELAAARTTTFTPAEILAALEQGDTDLERPGGHGPDRHRSLHAAITWSTSLLSTATRTALEDLAVLPGPFTVELATHALEEPETAAAHLLALVEDSLLRREVDGGRSVYRLLEVVRAVALDGLDRRDGREAAWARVVDGVGDELVAIGRMPVMDRQPVPHLLTGGFPITRRVIEGVLDGPRPERALAMVRSFWVLEDFSTPAEAAGIIHRVLDRVDGGGADRDIALGILATLQQQVLLPDEAARSAELAIATGNPIAIALAHRTLGHNVRRTRDWDTAIAHYRTAAAAADGAGATALATETVAHHALALARAGRPSAAVTLLEERLATAPPSTVGTIVGGLFLAWATLLDDPDDARVRSQEVLEAARSMQDGWGEATACYQLGVIALLDGDDPTAARHLRRSLELFHANRSRTDVVIPLMAAAALFRRTGQPGRAQAALAALPTVPSGLGPFEHDVFAALGVAVEDVVAPQDRRSVATILPALEAMSQGAPVTQDPPTTSTGRLVRDGDVWHLEFAGGSAVLPDAKGLRDLAVLLARPGTEVAALDLVGARVVTASGLEASDQAARRSYETRMRELADHVRQAVAVGDESRAATLQDEFDALADHVSSTFGLGGRSRRAGEPAERARSTVTQRIRATIRRIHEALPALGTHLDHAVRTGRYCAYDPEQAVSWEVVDRG